jgi:transketolase
VSQTMTTNLDTLCINTIRFLSADAVEKANSGHPGTPMALAPLCYVLWNRHMRYNPKNPHWPNRDRFILSAGHASMLIYSMLYLTGYDLPLEELKNFRQWKSRTPGHPEFGLTPGIETTTGPLGQGFANGVGMAIAERFLATHFNKPGFDLVNHYTYAICSDGDLMEGISHEAASLAGHLKLGKLIYFYDDNSITIDGKTDLAFSEDVASRFKSYGWDVDLVENGNEDLESMDKAITRAQGVKDKPTLIIVRTTIAFGSPNKQNTSGAHGSPLGADEIKLTKKALEWPTEDTFHIPDEVLSVFRKAVDRGKETENAWNDVCSRYAKAHPDLAKKWAEFQSGDLPKGWETKLPLFKSSDAAVATRSASGKVLNAIAASLPNLVGGSADLHPSTNTYLKEFGSFSNEHPEARNFHFGIREHGMGAIVNGMAVHGGLIPLCSTFLIFSDYMRHTIRLAALMEIRSIFVFTHDSVGLGEDGPTHQPIEHLMSLRAIPNLVLLRPADANEVRSAWKIALQRKSGPTVIVLTRQKLPIFDATGQSPDEKVSRGAYILEEADRKPDVILIATGSEVSCTVKARQILVKKGIGARVVSMPSWELFKAQPQSYRDKVLPPDIRARVSVEAGAGLAWPQFVGLEGEIVSLERFGASAPGGTVLEKLGFNGDHIAQKAESLIKRLKK